MGVKGTAMKTLLQWGISAVANAFVAPAVVAVVLAGVGAFFFGGIALILTGDDGALITFLFGLIVGAPSFVWLVQWGYEEPEDDAWRKPRENSDGSVDYFLPDGRVFLRVHRNRREELYPDAPDAPDAH